MILRNIKRNKSSFLINMIGLSTGLTCAMLIYLWINDELNVDKFFENDKRLYQVINNFKTENGILTEGNTPIPLTEALLNEMPEVEYAVPVGIEDYRPEGILSYGDNYMKSKSIFVGKDYFNVFSYKLIQGDKNRVLADKNSVVISERLAKKLFNSSDNVIGEVLDWESDFFKGNFNVSGIFKEPPTNATMQFDALFSIEVLIQNDRYSNNWNSTYAETYLILRENTDIKLFNEKISDFIKPMFPPYSDKFTLFIQQYSKNYLYSNYENGVQSGGRITYVKLFSFVAIFILLIACINFMNLSTAKASKRSKEVGIKKALGSDKKSLVTQYLSESMLITFLSLFIAIELVQLLLPQFNVITGKNLSLKFNIDLIFSILGITLFTGFVSGCYPAFYLSGFNPVVVLKGKLTTSFSELWVRKGLVVFQFALSVIFIVGLWVVNEQIKFTQTKNLGYDRDNIICFEWKGKESWNERSNNDFKSFVSELKNTPGVVNVTSMYGSILKDVWRQGGVSWRGQEEDRNYSFQSPRVSDNFIETLDMKIVEGRSFSTDYNDISNVIINESALKMMELKESIGKKIRDDMTIVGVVKDFNLGSLHSEVQPLILRFAPIGKNIMVKIQAGTDGATIEQLKKSYKEFCPKYPFEFTYMDAEYQKLYESESKVAALSKFFAGLAIIISCLGLYGLAAFTAERRRKEIGIRKVFGSTELSIFTLLSVDFTRQVLASIFIALPVSYFAARYWLSTYSSSIKLEWWFFAGAGIIVLVVAWLTVGSHALKVANMNPAASLRDE
jgi:ABC-type antimicrobial peptide transport system permease subunit